MRLIATMLVLTLALSLRASVAVTATHDYPCMTREDAQQVADNWQNINAGYTDRLADVSIVSNFTAYASSSVTMVNSYMCADIYSYSTPYFSSLEEFKAGSGAQPVPPFRQLNMWFSCETVFFRWYSNQSSKALVGMAAIEAIRAPVGSRFPWLIETAFWEYSSSSA